jgi:hypothetical protein
MVIRLWTCDSISSERMSLWSAIVEPYKTTCCSKTCVWLREAPKSSTSILSRLGIELKSESYLVPMWVYPLERWKVTTNWIVVLHECNHGEVYKNSALVYENDFSGGVEGRKVVAKYCFNWDFFSMSTSIVVLNTPM